MNRLLRLNAILGSLPVLLAVAMEARSELITFRFSGTVTDVYVESWRPQLQGFDFPDVGDPFTGIYKFESDAHDGAVGADLGSFTTVLSETAIGVTIKDFQFEGRSVNIGTSQSFYEVNDLIPSIELTSDPALADILDRNNFSLVIRKENLVSNPNVLPLSPPSLVGVDQRTLIMSMDSRGNTSPVPWALIIGSLDSLSIVPEPGLLLIGSTLIVFAANTRYRNRPQGTRTNES